jgi:hypothetical protein
MIQSFDLAHSSIGVSLGKMNPVHFLFAIADEGPQALPEHRPNPGFSGLPRGG